MKAEILCIGTELLLGNIVNTNAHYLSQQLARLGISVYFQSVVGDNSQRVKEALRIALERNDIVITTGGLGPTKDDLSREVIAEVMETQLKKDENAYANMKKRVFTFTRKEPSESNEKQAYLPQGCIPLYNEHGTAPGFILEKDNKKVIVLPGVPKEMKAMFEKDVISYLMKFPHGTFLSKTIKLIGISEANVNDQVIDLLDNRNPTLAPYAKDGCVELRITAFAHDEERAKKLIVPIYEKLRKRVGEYIFSENNESLEEVVLKKLLKKHQKLTVIEGATKGLLISRLCESPLSKQVVSYNRIALNEESFRMIHNSKDYYHESYAKLLAEQFFWQMGTASLIITLANKLEENHHRVSIAVCVDEGCFFEDVELYGDENEIRPRLCCIALNLLRKHLGNC